MEEKPPSKRTGRPSVLSRERILEAAAGIDTADLSFGQLALELGVTAPSLYRYFANLEELRRALAADVIDRTEFLDDHPIGDFESYLVRFLMDYRDWLIENELNPELFAIEYGAIRFEQSVAAEPLLTRLEDFLATAEREGVPLDKAMRIWWVITDWMATTRSTRLQERFVQEFHEHLAGVLAALEMEHFPRIRSYLVEPVGEGLSRRDVYEFSTRALIRGLLVQTGLRES